MFIYMLKTVDIVIEKKYQKNVIIIWCFNNIAGLFNCFKKQSRNDIFFSQLIKLFSTLN